MARNVISRTDLVFSAFGILSKDGNASFQYVGKGVYTFSKDSWQRVSKSLIEIRKDSFIGRQFRDLDGDGVCELIGERRHISKWNPDTANWESAAFELPDFGAGRFLSRRNFDYGVRFVDLDGDGQQDIVFANEYGFGLHLCASMETGWSNCVFTGKAGDPTHLPLFVRGKFADRAAISPTNNGAWFHSGHVWWQNEDTTRLPDGVDRRSFVDLLKRVEKTPAKPVEK